jgi:DNA polymerase I-like protein with 3'-5' exonuclease and polymerase domains
MPSIDDDDLAAILGQVESQSSQPTTIMEVPGDDGPLPIPQTDSQPDFNPPELDTSGDDFDSIMESMGANIEPDATDIMKAWMNYHKFVVVETLAELTEVVDQALKSGKCSLDLETEGLDNRIYWRKQSEIKVPVEHWNDVRPEVIPTTVHKIVGYCLSYDGYTGYYVPVRHSAPGEEITNIDPIEAGKEIKRLCLASQPVVSSEGKKSDPLGSPLLERPGKVKLYFWHAKFDQEFLYPVTGIDFWHPESFEDGLLIYYCIFTGDKSLGLKEKAKANLWVTDKKGNTIRGQIRSDPKNPLHELVEEDPKGSPIQYEMIKLKDLFVKGREIKFATLKPSEARYYACSDAICTFLLCDKPEIRSVAKDPRYANIYRLEKQVSQVLRWMERLRIKIDHEYVRKLLTEAKEEADVYRKQIVELAAAHGFNNFDPQSTQQLSNFLFANPTGLNIEPKPDKTSAVGSQQYKTDADTLEKLVEEHPDINPILLVIVKYRQIEKVIGTYLEGMLNNCDANQELRYQFKQTGAPTGRFTAPAGEASQGYGAIPIHGIPSTYDEKKPKVATALRKAFVAREGYTMVKIDFAGEELRIVTNLSREPAWIKEFNEGTGDLHTITAKAFFGNEITKQQRQQGKMANFSLVYGGGTMAIMRATKCTQQEAARRKAAFDKAMPVFNEWVKRQKALVKKDKGVFTAFGRWMAVPDVDSQDKAVVAACERYSLNYPIQGTGADIMKMSMVMLYKRFYKMGWLQDNTVRFLLTVHDELVFEVKHEKLMEVMPVLTDIMCSPAKMARGWQVPLEVEPLLDLHWDPKYDYYKIMHGYVPEKGKSPKKTDVEVNGRYYQQIPPWLEGHLVPDYMRKGEVPQTPPTQEPPPSNSTPSISSPPTEVNSTQASVSPTKVENPEPSRASVPSPARTSIPPNGNGKKTDNGNGTGVLTYHISPYNLTSNTVKQVSAACMRCQSSQGKILHLLESGSNETLIDPALQIKVDPNLFRLLMDDHNL